MWVYILLALTLLPNLSLPAPYQRLLQGAIPPSHPAILEIAARVWLRGLCNHWLLSVAF